MGIHPTHMFRTERTAADVNHLPLFAVRGSDGEEPGVDSGIERMGTEYVEVGLPSLTSSG